VSAPLSGKVPPDVLAVCRKLRGAGHEAGHDGQRIDVAAMGRAAPCGAIPVVLHMVSSLFFSDGLGAFWSRV